MHGTINIKYTRASDFIADGIMYYCLAYLFQVGKTSIYHRQDKQWLVAQISLLSVNKNVQYRVYTNHKRVPNTASTKMVPILCSLISILILSFHLYPITQNFFFPQVIGLKLMSISSFTRTNGARTGSSVYSSPQCMA